MRKRIELPADLVAWLDAKMPELGGAASVRVIVTDRLPFDWLPGDRERFCGITLWNTVYIRDTLGEFSAQNRAWVSLLIHEFVHVRQFRQGRMTFPLAYLFRLLTHGYDAHPAECEARIIEAQLMAEYPGVP